MFPHSFIRSDGLEQMLHPHHMPTPMERSRWKPSIEVAPNCPRCASTNTKFCYYNNYSLTQPMYFCKGCRRYWTKGGSLRNVPVGGGWRKNRRGKSSSSRHHQSQSLFTSVDSEDTQSSSVGEAQQRGSRDIDMALVFAKFLNPKSSTAGHRDKNVSSKNNLTPESIEIENDSVVQTQDKDLSGPVTVESANFELSLGEIDELERFLGEEDGLWSDATMSSSVTWEPPLKQIQLHELEFSLNEEDHGQLLPITSASTMGDTCWSNWSSFDLSTMEMLSPSP